MVPHVRPLSPDTLSDFFRLHHPDQGFGWCRCVAWWVPSWDGWGDRSAAENHALRQGLFEQGHFDGYLLYLGDAPIGWAQVGPRDRLMKLTDTYGCGAEPEVWAISCLAIAPGHRRQGMARALLKGLLADLKTQGIQRIQAYPKGAPSQGARPPGDLWNGPHALYVDAGFRPIGDGPRGPILELSLSNGVSP